MSKNLVAGTGVTLTENGSDLEITFSGGGATTSHAWSPQSKTNQRGTDGSYLTLSGIPSGFLEDGSDWSFAVRLGTSCFNDASITSLFCSDVTGAGVGIYSGAASTSSVDPDIVVANMVIPRYNRTWVPATNNFRMSTAGDISTIYTGYRTYKFDAGGGTWYLLANNYNTGSWQGVTISQDPDTLTAVSTITPTLVQDVSNFATTSGAYTIPAAFGDVSHSGGTISYNSYWAKNTASSYFLAQDTGAEVESNSWLVFSFDSTAGTFDAWVAGTKTNADTAATFGASTPTSITFGQDVSDFGYFYGIVGMNVTALCIAAGHVMTDADAAEFVSSLNELTALSAPLQTAVTNYWTFGASAPSTDKGSVNLTSTSNVDYINSVIE